MVNSLCWRIVFTSFTGYCVNLITISFLSLVVQLSIPLLAHYSFARKERIFTLVGFVIFYMLQCLLLVLLYFLLLMRCNFTSWICALVTFNILCVLYLIVTRHFFLQVDTSIKPVTKSYCCLSFLSRYVSSCFTRCFTVQLPRFELLTHSAFFNSTILYSLDC